VTVYLLDTHVLLWSAQGSDRLSHETRRLLLDPTVDVVFSVVSVWEIVVKSSLGRTDFAVDPDALRAGALRAGFGELPIRGNHVLDVARLPPLHQDPFDRILLAQARVENLRLLTADRRVLAYGEPATPA